MCGCVGGGVGWGWGWVGWDVDDVDVPDGVVVTSSGYGEGENGDQFLGVLLIYMYFLSRNGSEGGGCVCRE